MNLSAHKKRADDKVSNDKEQIKHKIVSKITGNNEGLDILQELNVDIAKHNGIKKNVALFINDRNLKECPIKKYNIKDLPIETQYGTVYLIKGKTILQFTTTPLYENQHVQFTPETWVGDFYNNPYIYKTTVDVHNIFIGDINEFANPQQIFDMDDMTSHNSEVVHGLIMALLKNKFKLYVNGSGPSVC